MQKISIRDFLLRYAIVLILAVLVIVVSIIQPRFISLQNIRNVLNQITVIGILSCGMTFVIIAGFINLSVGSIISIVGIVVLQLTMSAGDGIAILLALLLGAFIGVISGIIMSMIDGRLSESFMVTYGLQSICAALALIVSGGLFIMSLSTGVFSELGRNLTPAVIFFLLIVLCQFFLTKTIWGRNIYFLGANPAAARLSGINTRFYTTIVFTLCGTISALAGIVLASRVASANPNAGVGYELDAIAACVVGGISMKGGKGSFLNTLKGVIIIGVLSNALNLLGVTTYPQMMVKGLVIVLAVALDVLALRPTTSGKAVLKNA